MEGDFEQLEHQKNIPSGALQRGDKGEQVHVNLFFYYGTIPCGPHMDASTSGGFYVDMWEEESLGSQLELMRGS